eukprot:TRINITY_DN4413_c1_g1_i1.p1 TRINITY_DN4413_c1_g1~~TRINITY_DN4413_c1_g1_i1.p1  ORF type:complete len:429 (+),score=146.30 TRINITY_DN4413_c1_g1_i1:66-1352(+)
MAISKVLEGAVRKVVMKIRRRQGSHGSSASSYGVTSEESRQDGGAAAKASGYIATPLTHMLAPPPPPAVRRGRSTLAAMPGHMLPAVFHYLPAPEMHRLMRVCRAWRRVIQEDHRVARPLAAAQGLYVVGGINQAVGLGAVTSVTLRSVVRCNPVGDKDALVPWQHAASMHDERYHCATAVYNRKVYVFGGRNSEQRLASGECYDPLNDSWTLLPPMRTVRSAPACAVHGRHIYIFGGFDGVKEYRTVERFDPIKNEWADSEALSRMPFEACELGAVSVGKHIYIIGGTQCRHSPGEKVLPIVQRFDPVKNEWSFLPCMSTKRMCPAAVAFEGKLWVIGGSDGEGALSSVEYFDPATETWHDGAPMSTCRSNATATVLDGMIYVTGGFYFDEGGALSSVERYEKGRGWVRTGWSLPEKRDACKVLAVE